jgi:hypothetical protein
MNGQGQYSVVLRGDPKTANTIKNKITGKYAVALGEGHTVSGNRGFAGGYVNTVTGTTGTAFGQEVSVSSWLGFGAGYKLNVEHDKQTVFGYYNKARAKENDLENGYKLIFSVGNGTANLRNNANNRGLTTPKCKSLKTIYIDGTHNELYIDCNMCKSLINVYSPRCIIRYIDCRRCGKLEKLDFEFADIITSIYTDSCVNLKQLPSVANKAIQGAFKIRNCKNIALTIDDLPRAMTSTVTRGVIDLRGTACKLYAWEIFKKISHISPGNIKVDHEPSILTDKK